MVVLDPDGTHRFSRSVGEAKSDQCDVALLEPGGSVLDGCLVDATYDPSSVRYPKGSTVLARHLE